MNAEDEGRPAPQPEPSHGWGRRQFLKMRTGIGAAMAVPATCPDAWAAPSGTPRVVIVGAGMAGLNVAYQWKKCGLASTVYEARSRVSGRMHIGHDVFGMSSITDVGGELVNTHHAEMIGLAADFGIGLFDRPSEAAATGIPTTSYRDSR